MPTIAVIVVVVVIAVVAGAAGYFIGYNNRKKTAEAQIGSAEAEATRLVNEAIKTADQKRKEAILEAKDEAFKLKAEVDAQKAEADKEIKQRRAEISRQENRVDQKETALDRKTEALERKEEELKKKHEEADAHLAEVDALRAKEMERLETLAGLSQEDAREVLLHKVDEELTHEKAVRVAAYETDLKENCENIARNLVGQAISRCAADHCSETTVSVVPLPSDEMKGRIIGREGRNIRALETATGVDLIIDDTPEAITLSSFDQTRREVARMTLERLIGDGRIHPARIEETVEKCRHDLELQMKREGEKAVMELGIHGLHPDLIKLIGRLKYRTSFGQNALTHSMEVAWLAGLLAGEMGVNVTLARRAGLLHDIGKALDHEIEGSHVQIGVDICRKYKENTQVIHAIEAHHGDVVEVCNALLGTADDCLLASDLAQILHDSFQDLLVVLGFAAGNVDDDLVQLGDLHNALVTELGVQSRSNFIDILFFQTSHCSLLLSYSSAPHFLQTRTILPSFSTWPTRTALPHLGQMGMTLDAYIAPSALTMPPCSP